MKIFHTILQCLLYFLQINVALVSIIDFPKKGGGVEGVGGSGKYFLSTKVIKVFFSRRCYCSVPGCFNSTHRHTASVFLISWHNMNWGKRGWDGCGGMKVLMREHVRDPYAFRNWGCLVLHLISSTCWNVHINISLPNVDSE